MAMTTTDERIAQFENMANEDPDNDMAHFSLGNAYLQAGRAAEATRDRRHDGGGEAGGNWGAQEGTE